MPFCQGILFQDISLMTCGTVREEQRTGRKINRISREKAIFRKVKSI